MLAQLRFDDHHGFQRNTLYWTLAGAGGALLGLFGRSLFGLDSYAYLILWLSMGLGLGAATGILRNSFGRLAIGAGLGASLGLLAAILAGVSLFGAAAPLLGAAVAGAGLGLCWGPSRAPAPARAVGYALSAVVGFYVVSTFLLDASGVDALQMPGVQDAASGALMGFFLSLGGAVGRVHLARDPVVQLWEEQRHSLSGDMLELSSQGVRLYEETRKRAERHREKGTSLEIVNESQRISAEATTRLIRLAARWAEIESSVDDTARPRLEARLVALEQKLEGVTDHVIMAEYSAAAEVIRDQLGGFSRIEVARERLIARMHRFVASLERISLSLLQLSTSDAQNASLSLQPELERLDDMSEELSWKTLSVDDLFNMDQDAVPATSVDAEAAVAEVVAPVVAEDVPREAQEEVKETSV